MWSLGLAFFTLAVNFAQAERIVLRNGLLITPAGFVRARTLQGVRNSPNLILVNGQLMERDPRFRNVFRPLGIDPNTNQLVGATRQGTLSQVGNALQRVVDQIQDPQKKQLFDGFLKSNGFPGATDTQGGGGLIGRNNPQTVETGRAGGPREEFHPPGEQGGGGRTTDVAGDAGAGACRNMADSICSGNNGAEVDRAAVQQERNFLTGFFNASGTSPGQIVGSLRNLITRGVDDGRFRQYLNFLSNNLPKVRASLEQIRTELMNAIDEQPFSAQTKISLKGRLAAQQFSLTPPLGDPGGMAAWFRACGPTGFATNAFAAVGRGFVVICPGLLASLGAIAPDQLTDRLRPLVAHELTHQIGADRTLLSQRQPFTTAAACFINNFQGVTPGHSAEIIADMMAAETIGVKLLREGIRGTAALNIIRRGLQPLCQAGGGEDGDDGEHPSNRFRIAIIAGRNPKIMRAVCGTQPTVDRPSCTVAGLQGRDNQNSFLADGGTERVGSTQGTGTQHALGFRSVSTQGGAH